MRPLRVKQRFKEFFSLLEDLIKISLAFCPLPLDVRELHVVRI